MTDPEGSRTLVDRDLTAGTRPWLTKGVGSIGLAGFLADLGHEIRPYRPPG